MFIQSCSSARRSPTCKIPRASALHLLGYWRFLVPRCSMNAPTCPDPPRQRMVQRCAHAINSLPSSKESPMASATLSSKGQVTLPKSVRDRLGVEAGDRLEFIESEQGFLVVAATRDIRSLKGIVGRPKKPVTLEDMNKAIEKMGRMA